MAMNSFLKIPGIKGSARQSHVLGKIEIHGVTAEVVAEIDWKSGLPLKGKSKHKAMVLTKEADLASPALYEALRKGTKFDKVELDFWRMPPGGGNEERHYQMQLEGVQVAGLQLLMPNSRLTANELMPEQEELMLTYTSIAYVFEAGGHKSGTDPKEGNFSDFLTAEFEPPIEAKLKALALDYGKDATKALAAEVYKMFMPEQAKK